MWLYRELLRAIGQETLTVGTLGAFLGDEQIATNHTTPDPDVLFPLLARAVKAGIKSCAMEVSSHSLVQEKIGPIQYAAAAFTSFSRDHLDFHRHMNDYFAAKWRLFTEFLLPGAAGFIHTSVDPSLLPATLPARLAFYGKLPAPYGIDVIKRDLAGSRVALRDGKAVHEGDLPFFADHAAANFLAAWFLVKQSQNVAVPPAAWRKLRPVPGRLEPVAAPAGKPFVFVNYDSGFASSR